MITHSVRSTRWDRTDGYLFIFSFALPSLLSCYSSSDEIALSLNLTFHKVQYSKVFLEVLTAMLITLHVAITPRCFQLGLKKKKKDKMTFLRSSSAKSFSSLEQNGMFPHLQKKKKKKIRTECCCVKNIWSISQDGYKLFRFGNHEGLYERH